MARYNHAYDIGFEVISDREDGEDVTPAMLKEALLKRIKSLDESQPEQAEWLEACGLFDTHEEGK